MAIEGNQLMRSYLLFFSLCMGCYSQGRYATDRAEEECLLYSECEWLDLMEIDSEATCIDIMEENFDPEIRQCPDFDRALAKECIEGIALMDCTDLQNNDFPDACYSECGQSG